MDPLVFDPYFRPQVWGGRRLERYLGRPLPGDGAFGEAWVLSAQSLHVSRVCEGSNAGRLLTDVWKNDLESLFGSGRIAPPVFPLLFKYLDCQELLSVQVHPNDETAHRLRPGELGKTEAWVVLDVDSNARIYAGLRPGVARKELEERLTAGTVAECLHSFVPARGDCILVPAGTVHTIGGGVLIAEVQQSSDATFRLFDWNRPGPDGKPRLLHTQEALLSIDWSAGPVRPVLGSPISEVEGGDNRGERLVACPYFSIDRFQLGAPRESPYFDRMSFWMVLSGSAQLASVTTGYRRSFRAGETVLIPASAPSFLWTPLSKDVTLLGVSVS